MQHRSLLSVLALFVTILAQSALAQPTAVGGEFRVNTTTAGEQGDPQVAMDADGDFVAVWIDGDNIVDGIDGSSRGIVVQRYDSAGNPVGGEVVVNTETAGAQQEPDIAMDPDGNFVVVWTDTASFGGDGDGDGAGIAGQLFDSAGNPVGGQIQVNDVTANQQLRPDVAMGPDGGFLVTWGDIVAGNYELAARQFDSSGNPVAGQFQVNTYTTGRQYRASIDYAANGDFVIAWGSGGSYAANSTAVLRRYDSAGNPLAPEVHITTQTTQQLAPSVAVADGGEFVVAWTDGLGGTVKARRFDAAGNVVGADLTLRDTPDTFQRLPRIAMDSANRFVATWAEITNTGNFEVLARQFEFDGTPIGDEFQVNTTSTGAQGYGFRGPDLAMDATGNFAVVWQDGDGFTTGTDGDGRGVYGQLFDGGAPTVDPTLVGHWPLDDGAIDDTTTTALNSAGNGLDGTLEGDSGFTPAQQSTGVTLDGFTGLIRIPDPGPGTQLDATNALTIALWVRPDHLDGTTQVLVSKDNAYELELGKLGAGTWDLRLRNEGAHTATTQLEETVWQHLAMTWDGAQVCSYYNGLLDGCSVFGLVLSPNDNDLGLGARPSLPANGGPVFHLQGAIDEVYVYDRALTDVEIADLVLAELTDVAPPVRSNGSPASSLPGGTTTATLGLDTDELATCVWDTTPGLRLADMNNDFDGSGNLSSHNIDVPVADGQIYDFYVRCYDAIENTNTDDFRISFGVGSSDVCDGLISDWRFNYGSGCTVDDLAGTNDLTLGPSCPANAPDWVAGVGGLHTALDYDGVDDEARAATPTGLAGLSQLSVGAWIRHDLSGIFRSIVDYRVGDNKGFDLYLSAGSKAFLRVNNATLEGTTVVADGQWHHVLGTYDGSELRLYVDGKLDASSTASAGSIEVLAPLLIGRHYATTQNPFAGTLDEVTIHGRALTPIEVLDLHNVGVPNCSP